MQPPDKPLEGQVALVAGATRAAGRGIARELAAAGAKVWCAGRSTRAPATPGRLETIEETAELITAAGGEAIAVRVDHTEEAEVAALAGRLNAEEDRLDILVNDIWGGDDLVEWDSAGFWTQDMTAARTLVDRAVMSHWITARHFAPMMVAARRGLIVEVTDGESAGYRGNLLYDFCKASANRLAYAMAWDLARHGVTALAVSPGFLRSEVMLERFGVTEANWRDGVERDPDFAFSETPHFIGRGVAALAADPHVRRKSGAALYVGDLAAEYGFTDLDGSQPHFGRSTLARLNEELAKDGPLSPWATLHAANRYMRRHLDPAHAAETEGLAAAAPG